MFQNHKTIYIENNNNEYRELPHQVMHLLNVNIMLLNYIKSMEHILEVKTSLGYR